MIAAQDVRFATSLLAFFGPAAILAQAAALRGTVVRDSARAPLEAAEVLVDSSSLARTSAQGTFTLAGIGAGTHVVRIRHAGFKPVEMRLEFKAGETVERTFKMAAMPTELPTAAVTAERTLVSIALQEFEKRRAQGLGKFLTAKDLENRQDSYLSQVLSSLPGLKLDPASGGGGSGVSGFFAPTPGAVYAQSGRSMCTSFNCVTSPCYMQVFIDGNRVYAPDANGGPGMHPPPDLSRILASEIVGVEVYRGAAETPLQFSGTGAACGTLVLWTRAQK